MTRRSTAGGAGRAAARKQGGPSRGMAPADIYRLVQAGDPAVSPSGQAVVFTVTAPDPEKNSYRGAIWMGRADGSSAAAPIAVGDDHLSLPRWSPDGGSLAFISTAEERSSRLTIVVPDEPWAQVALTTWPDVISELVWSPDGRLLAFVARDPLPELYGTPESRPRPKDMPPRRITRLTSRRDNEGWILDRPSRVFVVAADGSAPPRCLTPGPYEASDVAWSPDGQRIAFASARHDGWDLDRAQDLYAVEVASGKLSCLTETGPAYSKPAWSADGLRMAYRRDPTPLDGPRHVRVGVLDLGSGRARDLTESLDRNCGLHPPGQGPRWDGEDLLFAVEDGGNVHLYRAREDAPDRPTLEVGGERWIEGWDLAAGTLAFVATSPTQLPELHVVTAGAERRLTRFTQALSGSVALVAPERFVATSRDGTEVACWAMAPVSGGSEAGPVLLNIHGGPFTQYGNRLFDEFQLQAGAGFGVIYCNPRGSSGYEEAWGRAIRWPECRTDPGSGWGGVDYDDVMACAEEACRRFEWVDPNRLGVLGGSYGGYMTSWIIAHSDRFRAACSERACNNLLALEQHSDLATYFRTTVGPTHLEDPEAYLRQSPISYVDRMTTPLLIVHSDDDLRCPVTQAEELFVALRLLGRTPEYVRFPGESHELSRSGSPRHRVLRAELILDWFRRQLGLSDPAGAEQ
jgi:dipeptidyl aminopeptidase/acylaminoacyl peptidase